MLIPKSVLSVSDVASRDATRYHLNCLRLRRDAHGAPRAEATDGKRAMSATWTELDNAEFPYVGDRQVATTKPGFEFLLPLPAIPGVRELVGKKPVKPVLGMVAVDEAAANGTARFVGTDLATTRELTAAGVDGQYPNLSVVTEFKPDHAVSVCLDAKLLVDTLRTWMSVAGPAVDGSVHGMAIRMTIALDADGRPLGKPVHIEAQHPGSDQRAVQVQAWLCPIVQPA